jgi:hypothetical protein
LKSAAAKDEKENGKNIKGKDDKSKSHFLITFY